MLNACGVPTVELETAQMEPKPFNGVPHASCQRGMSERGAKSRVSALGLAETVELPEDVGATGFGGVDGELSITKAIAPVIMTMTTIATTKVLPIAFRRVIAS
jgi:hypothetical protein